MKNLAVIFAVALLLLFGCFGGGENNGASGTNGGAGANAGAGEGAGNASGGSGASNGTGMGSSGFDVASSTISEIIAAGVPVVCEINKTNQTGVVYERVYLKGEDFRYETKYEEDGEAVEVAMVKSGNTVYGFDSKVIGKAHTDATGWGRRCPKTWPAIC